MENKINIYELLKGCPKGMELDSPVWNNIVFEEIDCGNIVIFRKSVGAKVYLTQYGAVNSIDGNCVIFPKGKTTWKGFVPPCKFKNGDIIYVKDKYNWSWCSIMNNCKNEELYTYVDYCINNNTFYHNKPNILCEHKYIIEYRLATEEEKEKLFQVIKDNGYKWNAETKTLEKLIEPKFKVGDRIRLKENHNYACTITGIREEENKYECGVTFVLRFSEQDNWELVPNKFDITTLKPFESRVLVRDCNSHVWEGEIFTRYTNKSFNNCDYVTLGGSRWKQCIPYNDDTKYLLGTTNDCNDYYKNWK